MQGSEHSVKRLAGLWDDAPQAGARPVPTKAEQVMTIDRFRAAMNRICNVLVIDDPTATSKGALLATA